MADTTFINGTVIEPAWLNDVNDVVYTDLGGVGGLSNTSDTTKGDALIGVKRTGAVATTLHDWIERRTIFVRDFATGGSGTTGDPWTGWDTAITWSANTTYEFCDGYFAYTTSPAFGAFRQSLIGTNATVIRHTGTGYAMVFDGGDYPADGYYRVQVKGIQLESNASASGGLDLRAIHHSEFDMSFRNIPGNCVRIRWAVLNRYTFSKPGGLVEGETVTATTGILLGPRDTNEKCTFSVFYNPRIYGCTSWGVDIVSGGADNNVFLSGAIESCANGLRMAANNFGNQIQNTDFEGNTTTDLDISGSFTTIDSIFSTKIAYVRSGATSTTFRGGVVNSVTIDSGAVNTSLEKLTYAANGGSLSDSGTNTTYEKIRNSSSGALIPTPGATVASAATITLPYGAEVVLITGTTNITAITARDGQRVTLVFAGALTIGGANVIVTGGTFVTSNNDTLTLVCLGSNWFECSRAVI